MYKTIILSFVYMEVRGGAAQSVWVLFPAEKNIALFRSFQTGSKAHSLSYTLGTGESFHEGKMARLRCWPLTSIYIFIILSVLRLSPLRTAPTTGLLYQPQMIDDDDCVALNGMRIGRGNRSTRRKPAPVPLCPPQIPHDLNRAAAVGSQRLTA
jgi:hypothetical protein